MEYFTAKGGFNAIEMSVKARMCYALKKYSALQTRRIKNLIFRSVFEKLFFTTRVAPQSPHNLSVFASN